VIAEEVEGAKAAFPEYTAVMLSPPAGSEAMTKAATPDEFTLPVPSSVAPLKKLTDPRGFPVGAGEIVAVIVTDCPNTAGLGEAVTVVVLAVVAGLIVSVMAVEVEVAKPTLPE